MQVLYSDELVILTEQQLVLRRYYYPKGDKAIALADIEEIVECAPTFATGKWRVWGTGNFRIWFARDWKRSKRSAIYHLKIKNRYMRCGFTVEDAPRFSSILENRGLLRRQRPA
jgi:hypothetical protein